MGKWKTHEEFIKELSIKNENVKPLEKYHGVKEKILCECKTCGNKWYPTPDNLLQGRGCPNCRNEKLRKNRVDSYEDFFKKVNALNGTIEVPNEYDGYHNAKTHIPCKCKICGYTWTMTPDNILRGKGCPNCKIENTKKRCTKSNEEFVAEIEKINPNIQILTKYCHSHSKVKCQCLECKHIWEVSPTSLLGGTGCPKCNNSKGELFISNYFDNNNIAYEPQKKFDDLIGLGGKQLSYDFYIPKYNILIEYDGVQHFKPIDVFGGEEYFKIQQEHDKRKRKYAKSNGFLFLGIPYWDFDNIEDILNKYLKEVA